MQARFVKRSYLYDVMLLALACAVFYVLWLGKYPLFIPDEGRYSEVAREMVASGDYVTPRVNGVAFLDKPVLYYWLQAAAINLFGVKEWALRLFPVLFAIFGSLLTYITGRALFDRRTGLLSAIILATTPLYFANAHYANLDLEVAVLVSASLLTLMLALNLKTSPQRTKYLYLAAYVFASLAFLTKGLLGIAFPCLIGGAWMLLTRQLTLLKRMHLSVGIFIFLAINLPWYILVQKANPEFLHFFFVTQQVSRFLSNTEFNNPTPIWFYAPIVLIGFFPWTIFMAQAIYQGIKTAWQKTDRSLLFLLLWAALVFAFFSIPRSKTIGYILPIFPALSLLVGNYLSRALTDTTRASLYIATALFVVFAAVLSAMLFLVNIEQWVEISSHFTPYMIAIAAAFLLSAIAAMLCLTKRSFLPLIVICIACNVIFLLSMVNGARHLNQGTSKPLINEIQSRLLPSDEVVNYYKFYQDVPLYLGRRITLVADWQSSDIPKRDNWVRELWYGMPFQNTETWLINEEAFWQRFKSKKHLYVFLNENYFEQFKAQHVKFYLLRKYNDILLISNEKPISERIEN